MDCEKPAQEIDQRFQGTTNIYFRLNVEQGLQSIELAKLESLNEVIAHTEQYMRMVAVDKMLEGVVLALRERRCLIATSQLGTSSLVSTIRLGSHLNFY
jgi:hypothetical protein